MRSRALLVPLLVMSACTVDADLSGKSCPCAPGWSCDETRALCVRATDAGDASPDGNVDADVDEDASVSDGDDGGGAVLSFEDGSAETFGAGTFIGTRAGSDGVELTSGASAGELVSRIFDARAAVDWQTLRWVPAAPYEKPLPDGAATETGYDEGNVDMSQNVFMLHLDFPRALAHASSIIDASGRGNDAVVWSAGAPMLPVPGRIDTAAADRRDTYLYVPLSSTEDFEFGTDDLTWSLWVNTIEDCSERNRVHLGVEGGGSESTHLWLGCTGSENSFCPVGEAGGRTGGTFRSVHNAADGSGFCGRTVINDGRWHHLVVVKSGHSSATIGLWVDGELDAEVSADFLAPFAFPEDPDLTVGDFTGGTYPSLGSFDEVAIWRRALSGDEIRAVYRRGALRLRFQVRACDEPTCSDAPEFVGPDGTQTTFFVDRRGPAETTTEHALPPLAGRYVQYRAVLESDLPGESPTLQAVTITGRER